MAEIIRNRTIRPSSRKETSKSYKVTTEKVLNDDTLIVNIDHESKPFKKSYRFKGSDVANRKSISFTINDYGNGIDINWSGANPIKVTELNLEKKPTIKKKAKSKSIESNHYKESFAPLAADDIEILILGTMPGDKSIELNEYYANPQNRFWKIIAKITNSKVPENYNSKKEILEENKIGLWDIAKSAKRKGSLDLNIENAEHNDLNEFLKSKKNLKVIGFNGKKAHELFKLFFQERPNIKYIILPSTSSANTSITFENSCKVWQQIFTNDSDE